MKGMRDLAVFFIFSAIVFLLFLSVAETVRAYSQSWFWSEKTGYLNLTDFSWDQRCTWSGMTSDSLQRAGECDPYHTGRNRYQVLTHNWQGCDYLRCNAGLGGESNIPLMSVGDEVQLYDSRLFHVFKGRVIEVLILSSDHPTMPQDEFPCPSLCGTVVTSFGDRGGLYDRYGRAIVRFSLE